MDSWGLKEETSLCLGNGQCVLLPNQRIITEFHVSETEFFPVPLSPSLFYVTIYNGPQGKSTFYPRINFYNSGLYVS